MEARAKFVSVARGLAYEFYATPEALCRAGFAIRVRSRSASANSPSSSAEPRDLSPSCLPSASEESPVPDIKNSVQVHGSLPADPGLENLKVHSDSLLATASPAPSPRRRKRALGAIADSLRSLCQLNARKPSAPASSGSSPVSSTGTASSGSHKQRRMKAYKLAHPEKFPSATPSPAKPVRSSGEPSFSSKSGKKSRVPPSVTPSSKTRVSQSSSRPSQADVPTELSRSSVLSQACGVTICTKCGKSCYVRPQYLDGNGDTTVVRKNTPACPCFDAEVKDAQRQAKKNALELSGARESMIEDKCSTHLGSISCSPGAGSPSCVFRSIDLVPEPVSSRTVKPKKEKKVREKKKSQEEITSATWQSYCSYHPYHQKCEAHRRKAVQLGIEPKCKPPWRVHS